MLAVRLLRLVNGQTMYEFSRRTGIAASRLSLLERGLAATTSAELARISEGVGYKGHDPRRLLEAVKVREVEQIVA